MNSRELARFLVLGGVLSGLTAGTNLRADTLNTNPQISQSGIASAEPMANKSKKVAAEKHACKGLNSCKGQGADGKNSCKGKGSCASKGSKHDCAGKNACKGQGQGGKNDCKGKGGCAVPPKAS